MGQTTPLRELIEIKLERPLREYVIERRAAGRDWRGVAADINEIAPPGVSHETLRAWFLDDPEVSETTGRSEAAS